MFSAPDNPLMTRPYPHCVRTDISLKALWLCAILSVAFLFPGCSKTYGPPMDAPPPRADTEEPVAVEPSPSAPEEPEKVIQLDDPIPPAGNRSEPGSDGNAPDSDPIRIAEKKAKPAGRKILETGRELTLAGSEIIRGGCWDFVNAVYNRAGFPQNKRRVIFKGAKKKGPYADIHLFQPGDWLYYVNHWYGRIEHSAIFVDWIDYDQKEALMLSYGGEKRNEPARYIPYDLSNVYYVVRPASE